MVLGVDLFGTRGGAEKAGGAMKAFGVGFNCKCRVPGVGIRLALECRLEIAQRDLVFDGNLGCEHGVSSYCAPKTRSREEDAL
jgi:hypothetical protein